MEASHIAVQPLRLRVLGGAGLAWGERALSRLERKTAGLLAYLALEGQTPRSRLAGLLWPESVEATARNNLAQALRRLKEAVGGQVVVGGDALSLERLDVDATALEITHFSGLYSQVIQTEGELLEGYDYDDCPEFADWLLVQRERLAGLHREALAALADEHEQSANYREALGFAEQLLETDPLSEVAHRRVMRLLYLLGDRAAALKAYARCAEVLERELKVKPLPETQALAEQIEQGLQLGQTSSARPEIPLAILRPPKLLGRAAVWAQMEAAWERDQAIFVAGPAGVGKSRLIQDFLASKGRVYTFEGRPGDSAVPYASHSRTYREMLRAFPKLALPQWVQSELSRILPELGQAPPPMQSEADKLRFFQAQAEATRLAVEAGMKLVALEDLQFVDAASLEAAYFVYSQHWGHSDGLRMVLGFRSGELWPQAEGLLAQAVESGVAVRIDLEPLDAKATWDLLQSLEIPQLSHAGSDGDASQTLYRYTGGNPFFLLETLKGLLGSGELGATLPKRLPTSGKVKALIERRLGQLSAPALNLARTASVAGVDFGLELAAKVLEQNPLSLAEPWEQLEAAQILKDNRFVHDLLGETVYAGIPIPIKTYLHRKIALQLESGQAEPARVAQHWLGAEPLRAVPFLLEAASKAQMRYRLVEAVDFYQQAAEALIGHERSEAAAEALMQALEIVLNFDIGSQAEAMVEQLLSLKPGAKLEAKAWLTQAMFYLHRGQNAEATQSIAKALQRVQAGSHPDLELEALNLLGIVQRRQGQLSEAEQALERALKLCDQLEAAAEALKPAVLSNLALVLQQLDRHSEAAERFRQAADLQKDQTTKVRVLNNLSICLSQTGRVRESYAVLEQALSLLEGLTEAKNARLVVLTSLGNQSRSLARYSQSLQYLGQALEYAKGYQHWKVEDLYRNFARTLVELGQFEQAQGYLSQAFDLLQDNERDRGLVWLIQARLALYQGQDATAALDQAEQSLTSETPNLALHQLWLERLRVLTPKKALLLATKIEAFAKQKGFRGLQMAAQTRLAQALLALKRPAEALSHTEGAYQDLQTHQPDLYMAELLWTHYRALEASRDARAKPQLEQTLHWLGQATSHVPPEYRQGFLSQNPINKSILEAAQEAGLKVS